MAKGYALSGNLKGKKGSSIFYTIANSNNKVTQGVREYQPNVTNPRSQLQAAQRMKLAPLNNIYRVFQPILSRSFQGVKYGSMSRQEFIKVNLTANNGVLLPYVLKGVLDPVPGNYIMSRGGLQGLDFKIGQSSEEDERFDSVYIYAPGGDTPTLGVLSEQIIAANDGVQNGDQITFIVVKRRRDNGRLGFQYSSFYLDTTSTQDIDGFAAAINFSQVVHLNTSGRQGPGAYFMINEADQQTPAADICACCVIQSRQLDSATNYWARSTSRMIFEDSLIGNYFTAEAFEAALASYRQGAAAGSDWEVDMDGHDSSGSGGTPNSQVIVQQGVFEAGGVTLNTAFIANSGHSMEGRPIVYETSISAGASRYYRGVVNGFSINFDTTNPLTDEQIANFTSPLWVSYQNARPYLSRYSVTLPSDYGDDEPPTENP